MSESEKFWTGKKVWELYQQKKSDGSKYPEIKLLARITKPIETDKNHYDVFNPVNSIVFSSPELWRCIRFVEDHLRNGTWDQLL